jgi:hypothetical protein
MALSNERWTRMDLPVWVALAVLLALGCAIVRSVDGRTTSFADPQGRLRLRYPAGWLAVPGSSGLLDVQDPLSGAPVPARLRVTREERTAGQSLTLAASETALARSQQLPMYRVIAQRPLQVAGQDAVAIDYAFVDDPHGTVLFAERLPVVVRGAEAVFLANGSIYHIDVRAPAGASTGARPLLDRVLRSVRLREGGSP